jgi:hypothetical protein
MRTSRNTEDQKNRIADVMLKSDCFCTLNPTGWEAKWKAFIATMVRTFGAHYP